MPTTWRPWSSASATRCVSSILRTQQETFAFPANGSVALDVRVKFTGGDVIGVLRPDAFAVYDAASEVVL